MAYAFAGDVERHLDRRRFILILRDRNFTPTKTYAG
jgi:hypothetical protein